MKNKQLNKAVLVSLLLVGAGLGARAQRLLRLHTGITLNQVYFSPSIAQNWVPGNLAGLDYSYVNEQGAGIRIGIGWMHKGWDINIPDSSYARVFDQLELPFLSRFVLGKNRTQLYIEAGPSLSYTYAATEYIDGVATPYGFDPEVDRRLGFGLRGELGVLRNWGSWVGNVGFGYHQDLTNFDRSTGVIYALHQNIILSVGIARVIGADK